MSMVVAHASKAVAPVPSVGQSGKVRRGLGTVGGDWPSTTRGCTKACRLSGYCSYAPSRQKYRQSRMSSCQRERRASQYTNTMTVRMMKNVKECYGRNKAAGGAGGKTGRERRVAGVISDCRKSPQSLDRVGVSTCSSSRWFDASRQAVHDDVRANYRRLRACHRIVR